MTDNDNKKTFTMTTVLHIVSNAVKQITDNIPVKTDRVIYRAVRNTVASKKENK